MPRRNALSAFIRGIRGEKPRSPGSRPRSDRSWRCRRAGFDRVEKHAGDIQPELRIQLADARRAGDVDLGEVVADHVQADEAPTELAHPRADLDRESVLSGKSVSVRVDLGGRRIIKKKNKT